MISDAEARRGCRSTPCWSTPLVEPSSTPRPCVRRPRGRSRSAPPAWMSTSRARRSSRAAACTTLRALSPHWLGDAYSRDGMAAAGRRQRPRGSRGREPLTRSVVESGSSHSHSSWRRWSRCWSPPSSCACRIRSCSRSAAPALGARAGRTRGGARAGPRPPDPPAAASSTRQRSSRRCASCAGTSARSPCSRSGSCWRPWSVWPASPTRRLGFDWAPAFVLGAIVSPTDPVAATAIGRQLGVPHRIVTIVEGESLINDGTALVAYKFAVAAVVTGSFSLLEASGEFVDLGGRRDRGRHRGRGDRRLRSGAGWTTRRSRSRSPWSPSTSPTCRPRRSASPACSRP